MIAWDRYDAAGARASGDLRAEALQYIAVSFADSRWGSLSKAQQLFAKLGHQTEASDLDVTLTLADNRLEGAQTLPVSFFDDVRQPYTWPDVNRNRVAQSPPKNSSDSRCRCE